MKKLIIILPLLLLAISFYSCVGRKSKQNKKEIVKVDFAAATIIDVRTPEEFSEGHIKNSINIPIDILEDSIASLKQYDSIVVVCRSGKRAQKAIEILENHGIKNVHNGMGWDSYEKTITK